MAVHNFVLSLSSYLEGTDFLPAEQAVSNPASRGENGLW